MMLQKLFSYVKPYKSSIALTIVSHILSAIFTVFSLPLIIPFFNILFEKEVQSLEEPQGFLPIDEYLGYYFSSLVEQYDRQDALLVVCLFIIVSFFFKNLFRYLASYIITPVRNQLVADLRSSLYAKYLSLPMSFFTEERKGNLITRMSTDITEIEHSILNVLEGAFKAPFILVGCLIFMIYISLQLTLFVFVLLLFMILVVGGISRNLRKESGQAQSSVSNIISQVEESLGGMKIIKAFSAEGFQQKRFIKENTRYTEALTKIIRRRDLSSPLSEFLGVTIVAILLFYGSRLVFNDALDAGTFFAFIFAFYSIIEPSKLLSNAWYHLQKGLASVDRVMEIEQLENEIKKEEGKEILSGLKNGIVLKNVSFSYKGSEALVLDNIEMEFPSQKVTALVGLSGAGKTSLVDLIPRFYDVTSGEVKMDNQSIKNFTLDSLRSQIALVSQDAILFNDTIRNNILFGMKNKSEKEVEEAARMANAYDFIMETPEGFNTTVGDRGVKLSGGQKQRITIARAMLKNPPILILDEATSALDAESEKAVQAALDHFIKDRTTIVIAHRLSTIKQADHIYVMNQGKVIEQGNHEELLAKNADYARFVKLQELN